MCVVVNNLAQVIEGKFDRRHVRQYNAAIRHLRATKDISLRMRRLNPKTLHVLAYTDASFVTNLDETSQLGFIVMLSDKDSNANLLHFASYKSQRVARSVLGAEICAFADAYDMAYCVKRDLETIMERRVPLMMFTDSKSLFDVFTKCSQTKERRLMIDLQAVRDAYSRHQITNIGHVCGRNNPADEMTKIERCEALNHLLRTGKCNFKIDQWVLRASALRGTLTNSECINVGPELDLTSFKVPTEGNISRCQPPGSQGTYSCSEIVRSYSI